jgi:hypothetical protein
MRCPICSVGLDRIQLLATPLGGSHLPDFSGFRRLRDFFVRSQTSVKTYARTAEYTNIDKGLRIFLQHEPQLSTLLPFKVTLIPADHRLIILEDIEGVVEQFSGYRFLLLEVALDFSCDSGIDLSFVKEHAVFGKSRPNTSHLFASTALYGARKAAKRVHCYWKSELNSFRIELALHSIWLRKHNVMSLEDLKKLPNLLCPSQIRFVQLDWAAIRNHLLRRGLDASQILRVTKAHHNSIHEALRFLRTSAKVHNSHRFLLTMAPTRLVLRSLKTWARKF